MYKEKRKSTAASYTRRRSRSWISGSERPKDETKTEKQIMPPTFSLPVMFSLRCIKDVPRASAAQCKNRFVMPLPLPCLEIPARRPTCRFSTKCSEEKIKRNRAERAVFLSQ